MGKKLNRPNNVFHLDVDTRLDYDPDIILDMSMGKLTTCTIIGMGKDGKPYLVSSMTDDKDLLWDLHKAIQYLMETE